MEQELTAPSDVELLRAARLGRPDAVEALVLRMRCIPRYLASINGRHGRPFAADALDDAAQQVFTLVWAKSEDYRGEARLETWVYTFCSKTFFNLMRGEFRRGSTVRVECDALPTPAPSRAIGDDLDDPELLCALERLDSESVKVLRLKLFEGLTFAEIAARLAIPANTAKSRHYRGLSELRDRLRSHGSANEP